VSRSTSFKTLRRLGPRMSPRLAARGLLRQRRSLSLAIALIGKRASRTRPVISAIGAESKRLRRSQTAATLNSEVSGSEKQTEHNGMVLALLPGMSLELDISTDTLRYVMVGPADKLNMITRLNGGGEVSGKISPIAAVTVPLNARGPAGIPEKAVSFAFAYPAHGLEEKIRALNLFHDPWGFFLLMGGYCYLDEVRQSSCSPLPPSGMLPCAHAERALTPATPPLRA
jgi:hypothetical protein